MIETTHHVTDSDKATLKQVARDSVWHGINQGAALPITVSTYSKSLQENGASFITLKIAGALRGCIGSLQAYRPLVLDVAENSFASAFTDPRFPPITRSEADALEYAISVLTPPEVLADSDEADLLQKIRPNIDGLILSYKNNRGTFLPAVWEQLPEPKQFLQQLKLKAGLPPDFWHPDMQIERYEAIYF